MEAICEHDTSYGEMNWDNKTIESANGLSKLYHSFSFIISFVSTMNAISIIKPICVKLQCRSYDIVKGYNEVKDVIEELRTLRRSDSLLHSWYIQAESLARRLMWFRVFPGHLLISSIMVMFSIVQLRNIIVELLYFPYWII